MTKVRKQKKMKTYRYGNRKRVKSKRKKLPSIPCSQLKQAWEEKKSVGANLEEMGLVYNANKSFKIPTAKALIRPKLDIVTSEEEDNQPIKAYVAKELEDEAKAPRASKFRLPKSQVEFLTYLLDKYGEDYKAMARDPKNYYQDTWKCIRRKIKTLKNIPEQYQQHLDSKKNVAEESMC